MRLVRRAHVVLLSLLVALGWIVTAAPAAQAAQYVCGNYGSAPSFTCVAFSGYSGQSTWGYPVDTNGHNCTNYAAYRLAQNGASNPGNLGNAKDWDDNARAKGIMVNNNPAIGAIAQWEAYAGLAGSNGHVAYVEDVTSSYIEVTEDNYGGTASRVRYTVGQSDWPSSFIHIKDVGASPSSSGTAKPSVVQHGSEMDVFIRGGDGQIYKQTWNGSSWSGFSSLGGNMVSDPVAVSFNGELSVFATGANGQIYKQTWNGSSWSGFNSLGGNMTGKPSVLKYGSSELSVFARGTDGNIYKNTWFGVNWSGFSNMQYGAIFASDPYAVQYNSELTVFARGMNNQIYKNTWNGSSWSGFNSLGGGMLGSPNAMQYGGEFDVFVRGSDNNIYKNTWNGSSWSGYNLLGTNFAGDPFGVWYGSELSVFVRGFNNQIYKNTWNGSSWSGFNSLGGNMAGDPTAISYNGELSVFATGGDGKTYKNTWNGSSWSGFSSLS